MRNDVVYIEKTAATKLFCIKSGECLFKKCKFKTINSNQSMQNNFNFINLTHINSGTICGLEACDYIHNKQKQYEYSVVVSANYTTIFEIEAENLVEYSKRLNRLVSKYQVHFKNNLNQLTSRYFLNKLKHKPVYLADLKRKAILSIVTPEDIKSKEEQIIKFYKQIKRYSPIRKNELKNFEIKQNEAFDSVDFDKNYIKVNQLKPNKVFSLNSEKLKLNNSNLKFFRDTISTTFTKRDDRSSNKTTLTSNIGNKNFNRTININTSKILYYNRS